MYIFYWIFLQEKIPLFTIKFLLSGNRGDIRHPVCFGSEGKMRIA